MDGLSPPPPQPPYFDPAAGAWILSRYTEVLAAFREARLLPVGPRGEDQGDQRDETGTLLVRHEVQDALSTSRIAEWQARMEVLAEESMERLPTDRPAELLHEFAKPWCMSLALLVTGADPGDRERLGDLGDQVFARGGTPPESELRTRAAAAIVELERYFETATLPMAEPTFVGISQTLPRLLVNGWLALFRQPAEVARLRAQPELMPSAVEELLRYAGIVQSLYREARAEVDLGDLRLAPGERVTLMIASANRDPEKFAEPDRIDVARRAAGQLALGIGRSSCAGARLIRMAHGVAIGTILRTFECVDVTGPVPWRVGSGFCWPASLNVALQR